MVRVLGRKKKRDGAIKLDVVVAARRRTRAFVHAISRNKKRGGRERGGGGREREPCLNRNYRNGRVPRVYTARPTGRRCALNERDEGRGAFEAWERNVVNA